MEEEYKQLSAVLHIQLYNQVCRIVLEFADTGFVIGQASQHQVLGLVGILSSSRT